MVIFPPPTPKREPWDTLSAFGGKLSSGKLDRVRMCVKSTVTKCGLYVPRKQHNNNIDSADG